MIATLSPAQSCIAPIAMTPKLFPGELPRADEVSFRIIGPGELELIGHSFHVCDNCETWVQR